jgi:glycosyltransferase involved in cell wall biosynthesis
MDHPLISCIVPVYNGEHYLGEALDSILAQTYRPLEILVVDDGSTDGTAEVVASYGQQLQCLQQANAGPAAARNRGLEAVNGKFVAFQDADVVWRPEKLERQMARFEARPELGLCVTHVQNFWIPELQEEAERFRNHKFSQTLPGYTPQTLLARRSVLETVGRFNPTLPLLADTDWFLRAAEQDIVMELLPDALVYRRMHQTNITRNAETSQESLVRVVKASLDRRRQEGPSPRPYAFPQSSWRKEKQ